ncbi:hypothetical protein FRC02_011964 [Tulasnella sp. 418]|nr:hypothetical protein FRC02_011964 [Tulasnella sp. 418]
MTEIRIDPKTSLHQSMMRTAKRSEVSFSSVFQSKLPTELLVLVLGDLSAKDVLSCCLVCKRFYETIKTSLLLKYHIALERNGPLSNLTTAERMKRLEDQEKAWLYLNPTRRDTILIPPRFSSFDLSGGILAGARSPDADADTGLTKTSTNGESDNGSSLPDDDNSCEMLGMRLPSVISGELEVNRWSRNVGFSVYGLTIDPSQDLAILLQTKGHPNEPFRVHIYSLSTFTPHPLASQSVFEHPCSTSVPQLSARCMENLVGVMLHSFDHDAATGSHQTVIIWDWKAGVMKACIESSKEGRSFDDFTFLTPDSIMLPVRKPSPATLDVYKLDTREVTRRSERLSRGNSPAAVRIATFHLPEMRNPLEVSVNPIACNTEPPAPNPHSASSTARRQPFYLNPASSLISFSFIVCHGHSMHVTTPVHERFTLLIQRQALIDRLEECTKSLNGRWVGNNWKTMNFPWLQWGPNISRFLTTTYISWACFLHGTKVILAPPDPKDRTKCRLAVLDFNPAVVAMETLKRRNNALSSKGKNPEEMSDDMEEDPDQEEVEENGVMVKLVKESGVLKKGKVFSRDVYTELPYRQVTSTETFGFANVVIDEERIGGILVNETGDLTAVEIFTM